MIRVTYTNRLNEREDVLSPLDPAKVLEIISRNVGERGWRNILAVDVESRAIIYPVQRCAQAGGVARG